MVKTSQAAREASKRYRQSAKGKAQRKSLTPAAKATIERYKKRNREQINEYRRERYQKFVCDYFVVYCIPDADYYVGYTNSPHHRMESHRAKGRDTDEWFILDICMTKEEAILKEREYHNQGYAGKNLGEFI